jgi:putative exporter of polyketide antibiotics
MQWFLYHHVLNVIGAAVITIVALTLLLRWLVDAMPARGPYTFMQRVRLLVAYVVTIVGAAVVTALLAVLAFWCAYPMTPDYVRHDTPQCVDGETVTYRYYPATGEFVPLGDECR